MGETAAGRGSVLAYLVRNRHRVGPKEELLRELWPDAIVADASLQRAVSAARFARGIVKVLRQLPRGSRTSRPSSPGPDLEDRARQPSEALALQGRCMPVLLVRSPAQRARTQGGRSAQVLTEP
ncbi:hypothetical protein [Anaeromyxobacter sp. PSR-1]|uniref:winged helix-turn-helix domain-containing protein n=1 Tax=Anaeromyxobacter sp. PSR-1 TaxID=1300915 RepID=UPI000750D0DF|nr:hypothetical protein [Anaeromyxobacter sp. PSR-1]